MPVRSSALPSPTFSRHCDGFRLMGMSGIDHELLAERAAAVERHLDRVAYYLPADSGDLLPDAPATDTVILHL